MGGDAQPLDAAGTLIALAAGQDGRARSILDIHPGQFEKGIGGLFSVGTAHDLNSV